MITAGDYDPEDIDWRVLLIKQVQAETKCDRATLCRMKYSPEESRAGDTGWSGANAISGPNDVNDIG